MNPLRWRKMTSALSDDTAQNVHKIEGSGSWEQATVARC